jgi:hypothetical protein
VLQPYLTLGEKTSQWLGQIAPARIGRSKFLQPGIDVKYTDNRR